MIARSTLVAVLIGLALVVAACSGSDEPATNGLHTEDTGATSNDLAPIFSVTTPDGEFSLSDHLANDGRPVFLNLWASWCFPCREEMPAIDAAAAENPEIAFIGVAVQDTADDAQAFADEIGVTYLLGFDETGAVDREYKPLGLPASYIISSDGIIVERIFGRVTEADLAEKFEKHFG